MNKSLFERVVEKILREGLLKHPQKMLQRAMIMLKIIQKQIKNELRGNVSKEALETYDNIPNFKLKVELDDLGYFNRVGTQEILDKINFPDHLMVYVGHPTIIKNYIDDEQSISEDEDAAYFPKEKAIAFNSNNLFPKIDINPLRHELEHFVQHVLEEYKDLKHLGTRKYGGSFGAGIPKTKASVTQSGKNSKIDLRSLSPEGREEFFNNPPEGNDSLEYYYHTDEEFYPLLKDTIEDFKRYYSRTGKEGFKVFVAEKPLDNKAIKKHLYQSGFFKSLRRLDMEKYKKAVKLAYQEIFEK